MTATSDSFSPARTREELRLVEVASGLLMLLDAHRLTGRLPLEVQVQASRLRHASHRPTCDDSPLRVTC